MKNTNVTKASTDSKKVRRQKKWGWVARGVLFVASFALTTLLIVFEQGPAFDREGYDVGEPAPRTLFAPFSINYVNESDTAILKRESAESVAPVLRLDTKAVDEMLARIKEILVTAQNIRTRRASAPVLEGENAEMPAEEIIWPVDLSEDLKQTLAQDSELLEIQKFIDELIEQYYLNKYILANNQKQNFVSDGTYNVTVLSGQEELTLDVRGMQTLEETQRAASNISKGIVSKKRERQAALDLFNLLLKPNVIFDEAETKKRREMAAAGVAPVSEEIKKNELIVQRGMLVSERDKIKLDQIHKVLKKKAVLFKFLAVGIIVFVTYLLGMLYLAFFEKKMFSSFKELLLIHTIVLLTLALCKGVSLGFAASPYLMPVSLAPLLVALLINIRLGILTCAVMAIFTGAMAQFEPDIMIGTIVASVAGVFASFRVRKRIHFLRIGLALGLAYSVIIFAFQVLAEEPFQAALLLSVQGLANGLLITTPIAFLLLPLFESVFDRVTDVTLLELSDLNHPLMKRMIVEAPGTYHHSLVVSTLAEAACEEINANGILARVGSYFHDIGKIARAEYFTENQTKEIGNKHDKLTPTMSSLIIMNHVKDGIALGRKYKLRGPILRFIPEHQGTVIIYYFYKKAIEQAAPGEQINPNDFRYPGPKPQSRESAVVLLADSTEAASRSLRDPTPESIRQHVRKIINDKFIDGQLDECSLTLRDLHRIQESFVRTLMAIFHTRVSYPDKPENTDRPDLFKEDDFTKYRINP